MVSFIQLSLEVQYYVDYRETFILQFPLTDRLFDTVVIYRYHIYL